MTELSRPASTWSEPAVTPARVRHALTSRAAWFDRSSYAVLLGSLLAIVATFDDYGMSWDEPYSMVYGRKVLRYFLSLGSDTRVLDDAVSLRGGVFHALVEALTLLAPDHTLLVRRLVTPLVGLLGLWGAFRLARLLGGARCGFLALTFLALTPLYYGHMFINPADTPFAAGYVWGLYFVARFVRELPHPRWSLTFSTGCLVGIAACVRVGGVVLLGYAAALAIGVRFVHSRGAQSSVPPGSRAHGMRAITSLIMITYLAMIAVWPAALRQPLTWPLAAMSDVMHFPKHEAVLFAGQYYWSDALPWFYHLGYLLVQLPALVLVFAAIGGFVAGARVKRAWSEGEQRAWIAAGVALLGSFVPIAYASLFHPVAYDGMRHLLFIVPPLVCLAGLGADWALARVARHRAIHGLAIATLMLSCSQNAWAMLQLHPYEYTYYNALVGGTSGATSNFELDYWITSFREATADLERYIEHESDQSPGSKPHYKLAVCGHYAVASAYLPRTLSLTRDMREADFVLATTKRACQDAYPGEVVAEVKRMGATFAVVKRLPRSQAARTQTYVAAIRKPQPGPWNTASMSWPSGSSTNAP